MCRVADALGITAGMRVPDGRESTLLSYLDRGIKQITVPNLQTKEEADALVKYTYFRAKRAPQLDQPENGLPTEWARPRDNDGRR